jgi:ornithine carbamoyltransferase
MLEKDFISIHDLTEEEFHTLIKLAQEIKGKPQDYSDSLKRKTLGMIFQKSSTRTRVSFEVGIYQLGGTGLFLSSNDLQLGRGETIGDTAKVLSRYLDGIMARVFAHQDILDLAEYATIPVINGLTDLNHPCQVMADYLTIVEKKGDTKGLKLAYVGDGNNMAHSLMFGGAKAGTHTTIITAPGFEPKEDMVALAKDDAKATGANIEVTNDVEAIADADIIYGDVWASMGQESEATSRAELFMPYQVNSELMKKAKPDAIYMHCLPAHRGEEVTDEVVDSDQSVVIDQAENRLHAQKAIMYTLMKDDD